MNYFSQVFQPTVNAGTCCHWNSRYTVVTVQFNAYTTRYDRRV